jgi:hypothetical protein
MLSGHLPIRLFEGSERPSFTDLAVQIPEIRHRLQNQDIEYRPVHLDQGKTEMWLPSTSDFHLDFRGHRFYRRHGFTDFKLFSVGLQQSLGDPKEREKRIAPCEIPSPEFGKSAYFSQWLKFESHPRDSFLVVSCSGEDAFQVPFMAWVP